MFLITLAPLLALLVPAHGRQLKADSFTNVNNPVSAVIPPTAFRKDAATLSKLVQANSSSPLVAWSAAFWDLVTPGEPVRVLAQRNYSFAHEAPVWLPETRQVFFVSNRLTDPATGLPTVELSLLSLDSLRVERLEPNPPILMANGGTPYGKGLVLVASQGLFGANGGLVVLDVARHTAVPVVNNWGGLPFNSPNDVAVHGPSGAVFFTDPAYGCAQGFRPPPQVGNWVWRFDPATNTTTPAADGFVKPNGVAFSPDFTVAYVTDTGAVDGTGAPASFAATAPAIYAFNISFDASGLPLLHSRHLFAVAPSGVPDGIKLDSEANVYVGVPGGVDVLSPSGQALGSILVGSVANLVIAGNELVMMQEDRVTAVRLKARGVQLPLQVAG